jgi:hypothetical protein
MDFSNFTCWREVFQGRIIFYFLIYSVPIDPTCKLCNQAEETVSHFLICCKTVEYLRAPTVDNREVVNCLLHTVQELSNTQKCLSFFYISTGVLRKQFISFSAFCILIVYTVTQCWCIYLLLSYYSQRSEMD